MRGHRWARAILLLLVAAVSPVGYGIAQAGCSDAQSAATERIEGRLAGIASSVRAEPGRPPGPPSVSFLLQTADGPLNVTLTDTTLVSAADGHSIAPTSIPPGTRLAVEGERINPSQIVATTITVLH